MKELRRFNLEKMSLRHLKDCNVGGRANIFLYPPGDRPGTRGISKNWSDSGLTTRLFLNFY